MSIRTRADRYGRMKRRRARGGRPYVAPDTTPARLRKLAPFATVGEVAKGTGLTRDFISRIFNQRRSASIRTIGKIASYLGVSMDRLLAVLMTEIDKL